MRLATFLIASLLLGSSAARADVLVTAEPGHPVGPRSCVAAVGGIAVSARFGDDGWETRVRESAGVPWRRLGRLSKCPVLRVAADGTAAIADDRHLFVRDPGGSFRAGIAVGDDADFAVSPGGWVTAAWVRQTLKTSVQTVEALTRRPDGGVSRGTLDRHRHSPESILQIDPPRVGIDSAGNATVVWTRWATYGHEASGTRSARSAAGGEWSRTAVLSADRVPLLADVAVSAGGHVIVAWNALDGVHAAVDGAAGGVIAAVPDLTGLSAAVNDSGAALITVASNRDAVSAIERAPDGGWTPAQPISAALPVTGGDARLAAAVLEDGRTIASWTGDSPLGRQALVAAVGRIGRGWAAPARLSSPLRDLWDWSLTPDGIEWTEAVDATGATKLPWRARLVADADAPAPDTTAPQVDATIPSRLPSTSSGRLRMRIPVRCSEPCTVRFDFAYETKVVELREGEQRTVSLGDFGDQLLAKPGLRRLPLRVTAADRAGNLTRRSHTVRVRVLRRPLRSFKVPLNTDFAMFSKAGDRAVARLVNTLIEGLAARTIRSEAELSRRYSDGLEALERAGYGEVYDTAVGDEIYEAVVTPFALAGYDAEAVMSW